MNNQKMTSLGESDFNTGTEIFGAWFLFISLGLLVAAVYYFTVVRKPMRPIWEKLYDRLVIPDTVKSKASQSWEFVKAETSKQLNRVPPQWKQYLHIGIEPVKQTVSASKQENAIVHAEDPDACVIGAPLEDDDDTETSPGTGINHGHKQTKAVDLMD
jgi:hypothetical protein